MKRACCKIDILHKSVIASQLAHWRGNPFYQQIEGDSHEKWPPGGRPFFSE